MFFKIECGLLIFQKETIKASLISWFETIRSHLTFKVHSLQRIHWNPVWFFISNIKKNSTIVMPVSRTAGDLSEPAICTVRQFPGWFYLHISPGTPEQLHLDVLRPCCRTVSLGVFFSTACPLEACGFVSLQGSFFCWWYLFSFIF